MQLPSQAELQLVYARLCLLKEREVIQRGMNRRSRRVCLPDTDSTLNNFGGGARKRGGGGREKSQLDERVWRVLCRGLWCGEAGKRGAEAFSSGFVDWNVPPPPPFPWIKSVVDKNSLSLTSCRPHKSHVRWKEGTESSME